MPYDRSSFAPRLKKMMHFLTLVCVSSVGVLADEFPVHGIMPRVETGAEGFLERHPEFDGRGTIVAIFDSGVDPGAAGLQTTPDGRPKIVDLVDGTGSGDVDMTTKRTVGDGVVEGLTGNVLKIDPAWTNPTGEFRVGAKPGFELFPPGLVSRLKREAREDFEKLNRAAVRDAQAKLAALRASGEADDKLIADAEAQVEVLGAMMAEFDAPGPIYDCIAFHDGSTWRAVVDTDEDGDFADEQLLTNFRYERGFASFGEESQLNFALNIYDDGDTLSIVVDANPHGTHVAGIVAAHFPDQPELDGVAPGAQIVSVKIGDTRLDGMETTSAIVRGLATVLQNDCDLINMSYGEPTTMPDAGRLNELISEVVNEHGVIFVSSAGNAGPALSTVGSPGGTTSAIFGVGAYVSDEMMPVQYSLRERLPENLFTWSSRGPTFDGDLGVNFCAPGGAFAPVPMWTLQGEMHMNGTSMSSPNACGTIALMLSGLKQENIPYTPASVLRAIENTARILGDVTPFAQGRGLIQIDDAFEHLLNAGDRAFDTLRYEVSVDGGQRGVLLREAFETAKAYEGSVRVTPRFRKAASNSDRIAFSKRFRLEASEDWIQAPEFLMLFHEGEAFSIRVDGHELEPGAHYGEVLGIDTAHPDAGPLFRVPVTVIRRDESEEESNHWRAEFHLEPGRIERSFLDVPSGATWADVQIRNSDESAERRFVFHSLQQVPGDNFRHDEHRQYLTLKPRETRVISVPVEPGRTMETTLAQYWSSLGEGEVGMTVSFRGLVPSSQSLFVDGGESGARVDVVATLSDQTISPSGSLTHARKTLRPTQADIHPLTGERDRFPDETTFSEIILSYEFKVAEDASITLRIPALQDRLYESEFTSQVWMLFDDRHRLLHTDDTWPSEVPVKKGRHKLQLHLRHSDLDALESIASLPIQLETRLKNTIALKFHENPDQALLNEREVGRFTLAEGDRATFVVSADASSLPGGVDAGDTLIGRVSYGADDSNRLGKGERPGGYPVTYRVPPAATNNEKSSSRKKADESDQESPLDKLRIEIRDLKTDWLARYYEDEETFNALLDEILDEWPDHLPALVHKLRRLDDGDRKPHLDAIIEITGEIIQRVDEDEIRRVLAIQTTEDVALKRSRDELWKQRDNLIDTLYRRARALAYRETEREERTGEFDQALARLREWVDTSKSDYVLVHIREMRRDEHYGSALAALNKHIAESSPEKYLFEKRIRILEKLGWNHWIGYEAKWTQLRFPKWKERF